MTGGKGFLLGLAVAVTFVGCGGSGGSNNTPVDIAQAIENINFYRVITAESRYYKEVFDSNGSFTRDVRFMNDDIDFNVTAYYTINSNSVDFTENNITLNCLIEEDNVSVTFKCIQKGYSGVRTPTVRWKTLSDAKTNPE